MYRFNGLTDEQSEDIVILTNDYSILMVVLTEYTKVSIDDNLISGLFDTTVVNELYIRILANLGELVDSDIAFFELNFDERKQLKLACKHFAEKISQGLFNPVPGKSIKETVDLIKSFSGII